MSYFVLLPFLVQAVLAQVNDSGFNENQDNQPKKEESWLQKNDRYIFIIVIGLVILGLLIWYIVRSIKGMRKRLARDNERHMYMVQQATANVPEHVPIPMNGYQKFDNGSSTMMHHSHRY
ncbi:hypothetical protein BCR43DRAFT_491959 [Syncephalastrum racemosum]|uniref:Mid2 domain-containing protein n=1 Tax=Syncephalastrum racemosum TaxID=13706 RepID=A0A1X2HCS9_SYNRA|nr:hypothetical protein BCR43DRAFT_491959 [Syncephalastrum racemosum]